MSGLDSRSTLSPWSALSTLSTLSHLDALSSRCRRCARSGLSTLSARSNLSALSGWSCRSCAGSVVSVPWVPWVSSVSSVCRVRLLRGCLRWSTGCPHGAISERVGLPGGRAAHLSRRLGRRIRGTRCRWLLTSDQSSDLHLQTKRLVNRLRKNLTVTTALKSSQKSRSVKEDRHLAIMDTPRLSVLAHQSP